MIEDTEAATKLRWRVVPELLCKERQTCVEWKLLKIYVPRHVTQRKPLTAAHYTMDPLAAEIRPYAAEDSKLALFIVGKANMEQLAEANNRGVWFTKFLV